MSKRKRKISCLTTAIYFQGLYDLCRQIISIRGEIFTHETTKPTILKFNVLYVYFIPCYIGSNLFSFISFFKVGQKKYYFHFVRWQMAQEITAQINKLMISVQ